MRAPYGNNVKSYKIKKKRTSFWDARVSEDNIPIVERVFKISQLPSKIHLSVTYPFIN